MLFGIFIYDRVEPIDLATYGVLSMARRIAPEIEICTIAPRAGSVALANGLTVLAEFGTDNAPTCDLVIVTAARAGRCRPRHRRRLTMFAGSIHRVVLSRFARAP